MIAERDNETVTVEKESGLIIAAKARIWASEGWQVVIIDADGESYSPGEFDRLLVA
jgi:predicted membrane GTPase involved in stress response